MAQVAIVAHRGASGAFPENTAIAFEEAVRLDVEMIELDVHLTRDRQLLVVHDGTVDRTSDGKGKVAELDLAQIKEMDAGAWMAPQFAGARFLVLDEALDLMPAAMRLNVHIKAYDEDRDALASMVVRSLQERQLLETAFVAADEATLAAARAVEADLQICNLSTRPVEDYVDRSRQIDCRILQPGNGMTTPELVREAHENGMEVNPFYADDEAEMRRLIACGVDGILTNFPEKLQQLLRADR